MNAKRLPGTLLLAGLVLLLGWLLLFALDEDRPPAPRPAAPLPAPVAEPQAPAAPAPPAPSWVPLATLATIDELAPAAPADRDAAIQLVEGIFRASGLEIRPDGSTRYQKLDQPELALTTRITEIAVYRGQEKLRTLALDPAPAREVVNEARRGRITFLDLAPGVDLQLDYDGRSIKELITLQPKLVGELAATAGDGDELRLTYRFDELRRPSGDPPLALRAAPWDEPLASGKLGPEQRLVLGRPGLADFELPPAWAEGGAAGRLHLARSIDLSEREHPQLGVILPLAYLRSAAGAITIDPTLVDQNQSMESVTPGEALARGPDGTIYVLYRKWIQDPKEGRWRWSVVWAKGQGRSWATYGVVAPVIDARVDDWSDQYHPTVAVTSDGTVHAAWFEYTRNEVHGGYSRYQLVHAYKPPAAERFVSTGFVAKDLGTEQHYPALAVDRHDNVYLFFYMSGYYWLGQWDRLGVTEAKQPPAPVGTGGTRKVAGAWHHFATMNTGWCCGEYNLETDAGDRLHVGATRCRPGGQDWIGTPSDPLLRPSRITWSWQRTPFVDNDTEASMNHWVLFGPSRGREDAPLQTYTYGDPGTGAEREPRRWMYTNYATGETSGVCDDFYYEIGDMKLAVELAAIPSPASTDNGDVFYVSRLGMNSSGSRKPYQCYNRDVWDSHHYRTYFARYDASDGRWKDQTLVFGSNVPVRNRYREHFPKVAVGQDGSAHVVAYVEGVPYEALYRKRNPDGRWEDYRSLVAGGSMTYGPALRGTSYPKGGDGCVAQCTEQCRLDRKCGNRVDGSGVDFVYTQDGNLIVFGSTGRPVDPPEPRRPGNNTFVATTTPILGWRPIPTDRPDQAADVCYKVEIASTALFSPADIVYVNPVGDPAVNGYICANQLEVPAAAGLQDGKFYYWRVTAKNDSGLGVAGNASELGVDTTAPGAFALKEPANDTQLQTRTPALKWQAACDPPLVRDPSDESRCIRQ